MLYLPAASAVFLSGDFFPHLSLDEELEKVTEEVNKQTSNQNTPGCHHIARCARLEGGVGLVGLCCSLWR